MVLQFLRDQVENVMAGISQQKEQVVAIKEATQGCIPTVQAAWVGGDADEFAADVMRKLIPAILQLIAAIAGINTNLAKAISIVDQADAKMKNLADGLGDLFSHIC